VLKQAGPLSRWKGQPSRKGTGFEQPLAPHQHWHADVSYINLSGTFYYLCSVLDGCSRYLVHWDLRESMKEADIERILERGRSTRTPSHGSSLTATNRSSLTQSRALLPPKIAATVDSIKPLGCARDLKMFRVAG
jgi:transposase InsO family protein